MIPIKYSWAVNASSFVIFQNKCCTAVCLSGILEFRNCRVVDFFLVPRWLPFLITGTCLPKAGPIHNVGSDAGERIHPTCPMSLHLPYFSIITFLPARPCVWVCVCVCVCYARRSMYLHINKYIDVYIYRYCICVLKECWVAFKMMLTLAPACTHRLDGDASTGHCRSIQAHY